MTTTEETPVKTPRLSRAKKFTLAGIAGGVMLGVGALTALPATADPAFTVDKTHDGSLHVEIHSTDEANGLEKTLTDNGVQAKVDFPPDHMKCDPDRLTPIDVGYPVIDDHPTTIGFTIDPDKYTIGGDTTLVIEISQGYFAPDALTGSFSIGSAKGHVGACDPVPMNKHQNDDGSKGKN
ncbi:MAG TPA: hypothetical protein VE172_15850 [Stackebrandtia sp.]|uniref:hypothetical protein n=1 Tax=Stackebrandtia sp. TaxID=2023065 RepID=UPI002D4B016F|nr:hypothetical protein [Stackebrandtia sp.]HZE40278.1 hypothetical protein [Stackebrandtia sp.]